MVKTININIKSINNFQQKKPEPEQFSNNAKHLVFSRDNSECNNSSALGTKCNRKSIDNCFPTDSSSYNHKHKRQKNNKKKVFNNENNSCMAKKQIHTFGDSTACYKNQKNRKKKKRKKNSLISNQGCKVDSSADSLLEFTNPQIDSHMANYWNRNSNDFKNIQSSSSSKYGDISFKTKKKKYFNNRHWNSNKFKFNNMRSKSVHNKIVSDDPQLGSAEKPDTDFFFFDISGNKNDNVENEPHSEKINNYDGNYLHKSVKKENENDIYYIDKTSCDHSTSFKSKTTFPLDRNINNTNINNTKKRKHDHNNKSNKFGENKFYSKRRKTLDSDIYNENNILPKINTEHGETKQSQKKKRDSSISLNATPQKNIFHKFPVTENKGITPDIMKNKHKNTSFNDPFAHLYERICQIVDDSSNSLKKRKQKSKTVKNGCQLNISNHEYSSSKNISKWSTEDISEKVSNDIQSNRKCPISKRKFSKKKEDINSQDYNVFNPVFYCKEPHKNGDKVNKRQLGNYKDIGNSSEEACKQTKLKKTHKIRKHKTVDANFSHKSVKRNIAMKTDTEKNNLDYNNTSTDFKYVPIKDCKDGESESKGIYFCDEYKFSKTKKKKRKLSQNKNNILLNNTKSQEICNTEADFMHLSDYNNKDIKSDFRSMGIDKGSDKKQKHSISNMSVACNTTKKKKKYKSNIYSIDETLNNLQKTLTEDDKSNGKSNESTFERSASFKIKKKKNKHCDVNSVKDNISDCTTKSNIYNIEETLNNFQKTSTEDDKSTFEGSTSFKIRKKKNKHCDVKDNILDCTRKNNIYNIEETLNNLQKISNEDDESTSEGSTSFKIRKKKNKHCVAKDNILDCNNIQNIEETLNNLQKTSTEDEESTSEGSTSFKIRKKNNKHCDAKDTISDCTKKNNIYNVEETLNNLQKTSTEEDKSNGESSEITFEGSTSFKIRNKKNKHCDTKDNILDCTKKDIICREEAGDTNNKIYEQFKDSNCLEGKYCLNSVLKNDIDNPQENCMNSSNKKIYETNVDDQSSNSSKNSEMDGIIPDNLLHHTENCDMPLVELKIESTSRESDFSATVDEKREIKISDDLACTSKVGETPTSLNADNIKADDIKECKSHIPEYTTQREEVEHDFDKITSEKMEFEIFDEIIQYYKPEDTDSEENEKDETITSTSNEIFYYTCDISDTEIVENNENDFCEQERQAECSTVDYNSSKESVKKEVRRISIFTEYMQHLEGTENETEEDKLSKIEICTDSETIKDTADMLKNLRVMLPFPVSPLHALATRTTTPTEQQLEEIKKLNILIKTGPFTKKEDDMIIQNWIRFCKEHDIKTIPSLFIKFPTRTNKDTKLDILRYIGHGLDNRLLHRIYIRFKHLLQLQNLKQGRFTSKEDKAILKFMENTTSHRPFSDLSKLLNRTRLSVEKRYDLLKNNDNKKIHWTPERVDRFIKVMMKITKCETLQKLQHRKLTAEEWRKLSKQLGNIPVKKLQNGWKLTIYPRLFCNDVDLRNIKKDVIHLLCDRNETDWKTVNWKEIAKNFNGFTADKIYMMLKKLTYFYVPKEQRNSLKECLEFLNDKLLKYHRIAKTHQFKKFVLKDGRIVYDENTGSVRDQVVSDWKYRVRQRK